MGTRLPGKHRRQTSNNSLVDPNTIPLHVCIANTPQSEAVQEQVDDRRFVTVKPDRAHWAMGILEEDIANLEV
jgi:hypothetical protein